MYLLWELELTDLTIAIFEGRAELPFLPTRSAVAGVVVSAADCHVVPL
jgi:hypothetical protein